MLVSTPFKTTREVLQAVDHKVKSYFIKTQIVLANLNFTLLPIYYCLTF